MTRTGRRPSVRIRRGGSQHRTDTPAVWWQPVAIATVTELEVRRRSNDQALEGNVDWWVWFELGMVAAIGAHLLYCTRPSRFHRPLSVCILGYCCWTAATAIYAPTPALALARGGELLVLLAATTCLAQATDRHGLDPIHRLLHTFVLTTSVLVAIGVAQLVARPSRRSERFSWLLTHSVSSGAVIAVSVVVLYGMCLAHRRARLPWPRSAYLTLLSVHATALVLTRTRGSIAAAVLAVVAMSMWWLQARGRRDLLVGLVLLAVGLGSTIAGPVVRYLLRSATTSELATLNSRTEVWSVAARLIRQRPLLGHGLTATRGAFVPETGLGGAHNAYLNVLVDTGAVGATWWLLVIGATCAALARAHRRLERARGPTPMVDDDTVRRHFATTGEVSFATVTAGGLMVCQLLNAVTAEWLGAGVGTPVMVLFVTALWMQAIDDPPPSGRPR